MIPTTLEIPSEYNVHNIIAENGKPLNSIGGPFEFFTEDQCGNLLPFDITPYSFVMFVYDNDCLVATITNLFILNTNNLYINEPILNIDFGEYQYKIEMVSFNTVISGKLTVRK